MNGSRSSSSRAGGASSLDALSRTIEGLEARIEGLMSGTTARERRDDRPQRQERPPISSDPLTQIRERQRALDAAKSAPELRPPLSRAEPQGRNDAYGRHESHTRQEQQSRYEPRNPRGPLDGRQQERQPEARYDERRVPSRLDAPRHDDRAIASRYDDRPAPSRYDERPAPARQEERPRRPISREPMPPLSTRAPAPAARQPVAPPQRAPQGPTSGEIATKEITQALISLRQDLKKDISEGFSREIATLRDEMRAIKSIAERRQGLDEFRDDLARLADSIKQLGDRPQDGTDGLRAEFEDLRSLMDGLAREESVQTIGNHWNNLGSTLDSRFQAIEPVDVRDDIAALADRLEGIKQQISGISDSRSVRVLEEKLIAVANALEQIGAQFDPQERALTDQFQGIDRRLDEISRAIAAGMRSAPSPLDAQVVGRLEDRLASIGHQIDALSEQALTRDDSWSDPINDLGQRIEALTIRIEDLTQEHAASRLEERIEQLSLLVEEAQRPVEQPELAGYLADISARIEALDHGAVNARLAERLDYLAHRIDELEIPAPAPPAPAFDDRLLRSLEERLDLIADRLNDTARAPAEDSSTLRGLEEQIAQLSRQLNSVPRGPAPQDDAVSGRIAALEDYMATSDEYIIEAARQAAEAVMETYSQQVRSQPAAVQAQNTGDMETLAALANNLKHLEDLSRGSEERTSRTFEALQETLLQIADRLDNIDRPAPAFPPVTKPVEPAPLFQQAAHPASRESLAQMAQAKIDEQDIVGPLNVQWEPARVPVSPPNRQAIQAELESSVAAMLDATAPEPVMEAKAEKPSLLAGLGRRLMPGQKKQPEQASEGRVHIDPTPSMDPGDILPPDEANELLEPGSGAPDVRKILERVRANQSENRTRGDGSLGTDADRTDYIAAARRAAQAAAEEMERTPNPSVMGDNKITPATGKAPSFLSRYRRPIMMAIGAILLAAMAMPLVKTLTSGDSAPQAVIEAPALQQSGALTAPVEPVAPIEAQAPAPAALPEEPAMTEQPAAPDLAPPPAAGAMDAGPADAPADQPEVLQNVPPAEPTAEAPAPAEAAPEAAQAEISVPAEITPASLSIAAKDGDPLALFEIAARYTEGRGVPTNLTTAAEWYQLSADRGFAPALYRLANLYEKGSGVERDLDKAKTYYEMAAAKGNASAMHNLAVLLASGASGSQDYTNAAQWFERAAELGVTDSQFNLAILYARGNGVPQNLEASYKWFAIAAKDGDKDAAQKRDEVANSMRPEQLEKARAGVDSWKATPLDVDANAVNPPDEWAGTGVKTASVDMKKAVQNIQAILNRNGYDAGTADGVMGKKTVTAIKAFQTSVGQEPTGRVTDELVKALLERNK
ncbi:peptidoglycan-binding protein [Rhizobium sp. RU36D]|uniref:peptidoglycan-binding protein n=1 Tax=Rhizobium sp. RU36D TaxID=1907415 RepID=UPI0009D8F4D2|nr:peptidoglycan-binding protein [Rhizobium sp. RU36D]SMD19903.1 localization factor PodJL [Rhizobium sp. RU36D]